MFFGKNLVDLQDQIHAAFYCTDARAIPNMLGFGSQRSLEIPDKNTGKISISCDDMSTIPPKKKHINIRENPQRKIEAWTCLILLIKCIQMRFSALLSGIFHHHGWLLRFGAAPEVRVSSSQMELLGGVKRPGHNRIWRVEHVDTP